MTNPQPEPIEPPEEWCCQDSEEAGFGDDTEALLAEESPPPAEGT